MNYAGIAYDHKTLRWFIFRRGKIVSTYATKQEAEKALKDLNSRIQRGEI